MVLEFNFLDYMKMFFQKKFFFISSQEVVVVAASMVVLWVVAVVEMAWLAEVSALVVLSYEDLFFNCMMPFVLT